MQFLELKDGVDASGVHPHLWFHLGVIARRHWEWTEHSMVITSLRRPWNPDARPSKHSPPPLNMTNNPMESLCQAADIRRWYLDDIGNESAHVFCLDIQKTIGEEIGVVLEPEWGDYGGAPHIHIQSKRTKLFQMMSSF